MRAFRLVCWLLGHRRFWSHYERGAYRGRCLRCGKRLRLDPTP